MPTKEHLDEALTYEELTALNRKQEEYIKELEKKIDDMSPKAVFSEDKIQICKPDYDELEDNFGRLNSAYSLLMEQNEALLFSLGKMFQKIKRLEDDVTYWKEDYSREYKRADKLFDELERLKNDK